MQDFFFILGCQRSGTTLIRLILDSHSQIHCFDEYKSYSLLANKLSLDEELKKYKNKKLIGFKTPAYTEQMDYSVLIDPRKFLQVKNTFYDSKMIFVYRDVRDVISSMNEYVKGNGGSWLETQALRIINFWIENKFDFIKKYNAELAKLEESKNNNIVAGAIFWKIKNDFMFSYETKRPLLKIKYEELCSSPRREITKICSFLNVPLEDTLLHHEKVKHDEVNEDGITVGEVNSKLPIFNDSIGRYENDLLPEEVNKILEITYDLMKKLEYKI